MSACIADRIWSWRSESGGNARPPRMSDTVRGGLQGGLGGDGRRRGSIERRRLILRPLAPSRWQPQYSLSRTVEPPVRVSSTRGACPLSRARHPAQGAASGDARAEQGPTLGRPARSDREPRALPGAGSSPRAHPDGNRQWEDLHRCVCLLSAHQTCEGEAHPISLWTATTSVGKR